MEYEPSMQLCISFCTGIETEMQTIHRAIKRKSLHLRRATRGKTNSLSSLVQASDTVQTQVLKRERISRFKREIGKIGG